MGYTKTKRLPPGCGEDLDKVLLYNPYQAAFQTARRTRICLNCRTAGQMTVNSTFTCGTCGTPHTSNLTAPRAFDRLLVLAGRGGGKTLIGAHACREEMLVPGSIGWVMGPTYKILHDSTFPTLVRLINPAWVEHWDPENMEIRLVNKALIAFRSLEDPERARGPHGVGWGWFDEAAQSPERAYDVFEPTLIKAGGIIIATTTVLGYDWTYDKIEKRALTYREPGYWACRYWTDENPLFRTNPVMREQIERAKRNMAPDFYAQEYQAERRNAQGLVYDFRVIEKQCLGDGEAMKRVLPEWPAVDPSRPVIVGLDSGADHPFGAVMAVATDRGLVVVREYLERQRAISLHLPALMTQLGLAGFTNVRWAANKNEANLRLEFGLKGVGVMKAEGAHDVGIQRVQSWLHTGQMWFAPTVPRLIEQLRAYRYADNTKPSGEKKKKEEVFKFRDELPDALRYLVMAWPELPEATQTGMTEAQQDRWARLDDRSRTDIERMRVYQKQATDADLEETEETYPLGGFYGESMGDGSW